MARTRYPQNQPSLFDVPTTAVAKATAQTSIPVPPRARVFRKEAPVAAGSEKRDIYQEVTDLVLQKLDEGVLPWESAFINISPLNAATKAEYRGINHMILGVRGSKYKSRYWLTYKQAQELGGNVRKGERGTPVVFWKIVQKDKEENGETKKTFYPLLKRYTVFNADQCDGLKLPDEPERPEIAPIDAAESIWTEMHNRPKICFEGQSAYYTTLRDTVTVPPRNAAKSAEEWYSTLFHELGHSTGHKSRLNRDMGGRYGTQKYGKEELIAEMTAAFLCAACGIEKTTLDNSAAYIDGWRKAIKGDRKMVIQAAAAAQKAADYIRNITH